MKKLILILLPFLVLVLPLHVRALALGDIEVNSHLNQPLNAVVPIVAAKAEELIDMRVELADGVAFERAGIQRRHDYTRIRFRVLTQEDGSSMIRMSTTRPVIEPALDLMVNVVTPQGSMQRRYSILLSPAP